MTTSTRPRRRRATAFALVGLILGALLIGLEVRQGAPVTRAAGGMAILVVFIGVIWVFQTRSETVSALAGKPVDERWQLIQERAAMAAMGMGIVVAIVGFAVMEVMGRDNWQFTLMALVLTFGYMVALVWYRWRV
ncbi:MAG: DUF2178 domain-containing protein [Candidatus Limnocylindrales bacterium]|jgi:predicted permease